MDREGNIFGTYLENFPTFIGKNMAIMLFNIPTPDKLPFLTGSSSTKFFNFKLPNLYSMMYNSPYQVTGLGIYEHNQKSFNDYFKITDSEQTSIQFVWKVYHIFDYNDKNYIDYSAGNILDLYLPVGYFNTTLGLTIINTDSST